ncbi:hypothetical protein [Ferrimonas balearica]|uniref:hypothetical protein n=1 Tax=Ferrimonas balearica TaxID=44012 RepID=UPI001C564740|nr:hypothetical protein [Ferrimonas balearica]MBW3163955.1 hypothetical protein [Ferrimonas balearica]MBY5979222.1 hypothetical protein [Ferrimonas balearica]
MKLFNKATTAAYCFIYSSLTAANASNIKLPEFATNEVALDKATKIGEQVIDFMVGLIGILIIGGMSVSAALASSGNIDGAKKWAMGSLIGGSLASMTYGFAQFFV